MKKIITILGISLVAFVFAGTASADTVTVVSDTSVEIVGVYNKAGGPANYVPTSLNAVLAAEPTSYPTTYVVDALNSVWDSGTSYYFQTTNPGAKWIWETVHAEDPATVYGMIDPLYDAAASTNGRVVAFEKDFNVAGVPSGGTLHIANDNGWEVWVNSQWLERSATAQAGWELSNLHENFLTTSGWQSVGHISVPASMLNNGNNTIKILGGNEYFAGDDGNSPTPPLRVSPYYQYNPGALIFKLDVNYTPVSPLVVTKTAVTSYDREWDWTINKTANVSEITLATGQQFYVNYSVAVDGTYTDTNWAVEGTITIHNPNSVDATIESVSDTVSPAIAGTVDCGAAIFPYTLAAGVDLVCYYEADLPDASQLVNTADITTSGDVPGNSDTADVVFGDPENETDECVNVEDNLEEVLGTTCVDHTYSYQYLVDGYSKCGEYTVENTASFESNDTQLTGNDGHVVNVHVPCMGCTLTQGYWKTHSEYGKAPYDNNWENLPDMDDLDLIPEGQDETFFSSGKTWYEVFWTAPKGGNVYY